MKRIALAAIALALTACNQITVGVAIAGIGIAGVGLQSYCASAGTCSPGTVALAGVIIREAQMDASILTGGQTTVQKSLEVAANLNMDLLTAKALPQTPAVVGVESAIEVTIPLIEALTSPAPKASLTASGPGGYPIKIKLTAKDRKALADMYNRMKAASMSVAH